MQIGSVAEIVSSFVAVIAFAAVVYEYRHQKRQWRLGIAQGLERQFNTDETLSFAVTSLDWAIGHVPVPRLWRDIVGRPAITPNLLLLAEALKPQLTDKIANDPVGLLYRHSFVTLFDHLGRTEDLLRRGAVTIEDLHEMRWVANELKSWRYAPEAERERFFMAAIEAWYSDGKPKVLIDRLSAPGVARILRCAYM